MGRISAFLWGLSIHGSLCVYATKVSRHIPGEKITILIEKRVPAVPFFAFNVLCWGILEMSMAACKGFGGLFACRFLLGGCEALLIPAVTLVVSMWYRPEEQPKRNRFVEFY